MSVASWRKRLKMGHDAKNIEVSNVTSDKLFIEAKKTVRIMSSSVISRVGME
jgi:hypothetical protein